MSFSITIDFDLSPEDLELLKAIGEKAPFFTPAQAVKELLREALKAKPVFCGAPVPLPKTHLASQPSDATTVDSCGCVRCEVCGLMASGWTLNGLTSNAHSHQYSHKPSRHNEPSQPAQFEQEDDGEVENGD